MTEIIRLHDIPTIPDLALNGEPVERDPWLRIDLLADEYRRPPEPPEIHGLLYRGKRHVISGPPESAKTLIAYVLLLEAQRAGHGVAIIDFEMGPYAAVTLLRELGATDHEIGQILYFEPDEKPYADLAQHLHIHQVAYVLLDAAIGAYDISGLDDNQRKDAEEWARTWTHPLFKAGISTLVIDHVTKNAETRGKYQIGSERKLGGTDIHLGLEALKPLSRGHTGMVRVTVHKDRPGHLPRPTAVMVDLTSDPDTHQVTVTYREAAPVETETGEFQYTIYMERISRAMEKSPGHVWSRNELENSVKGGRDYIRSAIDDLVSAGHISESEGSRNSRQYALLKPYTQPQDDLATTSPQPRHGEVPNDLATSPPPVGGEASVAATSGEQPRHGEVDVYDPDVQALLNDDIPF